MFIFWIKESFKLIGRAKSSFFLALISMSISVILIVVSLMLIDLSNEVQKKIKSDIKINIFLNDGLNNKSIKSVKEDLEKSGYTDKINYIDKKTAADNFINETGEDFRKLLDYNPLPATYTVSLKEQYVNKDSLKKIVKAFSNINGVDEVVYKNDTIEKIISSLDFSKKYIFIITAVLFFISIYIVFSTVKLITNSKYEEMETMKLVGSKLSTIKIPIILNSMITGILAGLIAFLFFSLFIYYFDNYINIFNILKIHIIFYAAIIIGIGPFVGFFVSIVSLRKISLKI